MGLKEKQDEALEVLTSLAGVRKYEITEVVGIVISTREDFPSAVSSLQKFAYPRSYVVMSEEDADSVAGIALPQGVRIHPYSGNRSFLKALHAAERKGHEIRSKNVAFTIQDADFQSSHAKHLDAKGGLADAVWEENPKNPARPRLHVREGGWGEVSLNGRLYETILLTANAADHRGYLAATFMQANKNDDYLGQPFTEGLLQGGFRLFLPSCPPIFTQMNEEEVSGGAADYASLVTLMRVTGRRTLSPVMLNRGVTLKFDIVWDEKSRASYNQKIEWVAQGLREYSLDARVYQVQEKSRGKKTIIKAIRLKGGL